MRFRFKIKQDGGLQAVYNDLLPGLQLGPMTAQRESNVEFNVVTQMWEARDLHGKLMVTSTSREQCLRREKEIVEQRIMAEASAH